jgi:hypothetical protein
MARPLIFLLPTLTALGMAVATLPATAKTDPTSTLSEDETQPMTDRIRDKLSAQGYKDITVMPTSYAVSATDADGKPVLLLIGPASTTPMTEPEPPSTAQRPPGKNEFIQQ